MNQNTKPNQEQPQNNKIEERRVHQNPYPEVRKMPGNPIQNPQKNNNNNLVEQIMNDLEKANNPQNEEESENHLDINIHQMNPNYESAEKPKNNTRLTNSTMPSLQNSGNRGYERSKNIVPYDQENNEESLNYDQNFEENDESYRNLPLVNPLLYKPASKPPVIREGDWLCPDPTVII